VVIIIILNNFESALRTMAGLEVLYTCVGGRIDCPQDAVICFVHWEIIKSGYRCVGSGDTVSLLLDNLRVTIELIPQEVEKPQIPLVPTLS
jgi:hypothetical protein